jgi:hypothetical protein
VLGNYAFVVGGDIEDGQTFHILDISNPAAPQQVASYEATGFVLADGYLYLLSDTQERLTLVDATTLKEVAIYDMPEQQQGMSITREIAVAGHHAYIFKNYSYTTFSETGWQIIDVSDPTTPVQANANFNSKGQYDLWSQPVAAAYGGYTFLAVKSAGLRVLDVTGVNTPTEVDSFGATGSIMDVATDDKGNVYVASDLDGLYVVRYSEDGGK